MQYSNFFVNARQLFFKYVIPLFPLLVLVQLSSVNAQTTINSVQNPKISNQIEQLLQQKMDPQDVELWINMLVSKTANPGGIIEVTLKLWQTSVNTMDSIYIIYLAPNSSLKSSGEPLYTKYQNSLTNNFDSLKIVNDGQGYLDSLIFFIPELPIISVDDNTQDTTIIKFQLKIDDALEGSAALIHWVTCYQTKNNQIVNRNYDAGRTDIVQKPDLEVIKSVIGNNVVSPGQEVEYRIIVRNIGKNKADSVLISDVLDQSLRFTEFIKVNTPDSADEKGYKEQEKLLWWYFKTIPINSTKIIGYKVLVDNVRFTSMNDTVAVKNWAVIKHGETFPDSAIATIKIPPPLFKLDKVVIGNSTVGINDTVQFKITLENMSTTAADSVFIIDQLPTELEFIEFTRPNTADSSEYIAGERKLRWFFITFPASSTREVNFRAVVREDVEVSGESKVISNISSASYKGGIHATDSAELTIISPADLVPEINSINKPKDWKLTDGIAIGIESSVSNQGGRTYNGSLTIKYWHGLLGEPVNDTTTVVLNSVLIPGKSKIPVEIQKSTLFYGGVYQFCMKIIPDVGVEKNITNNQTCRLDTIQVPLRFFLSKNVYEPVKTGDQLDLIFQIPSQTHVKINIYNVAGELIKNHVEENFSTEGIYSRPWDGKNKDGNLVASGVYICTLESDAGHVTRKVIVVR